MESLNKKGNSNALMHWNCPSLSDYVVRFYLFVNRGFASNNARLLQSQKKDKFSEGTSSILAAMSAVARKYVLQISKIKLNFKDNKLCSKAIASVANKMLAFRDFARTVSNNANFTNIF